MPTFSMRGMGLLEVIVGIALMLMVFTGLFGVLRVSVALSNVVKNKTSALEIANTQMEYLRGLPYDALGTVGGTPSGTVAPSATTIVQGVHYTLDTTITYYDDPADGTAGSDENAVPSDYKKGAVRVSYTTNNEPYSITLVSNFAPESVETPP